MRFSLIAIFLCSLVLSGCGYVGEPLPPALRRPMRVTDLSAVERGDKVVVQFTRPKLTTEGLTIMKAQNVEVRYGVCPVVPFRFDEWEKASQRVRDVPQDLKKDPDLVRVEFPAQPFVGKDVVVGVRVHGPEGRDMGWSNMAFVPIVRPLPTPQGLEAHDVAAGVRLDWHAAAPQFRIFRKLKTETEFVQIGMSDKPTFVDPNIVYGKEYQYYVQTVEKAGESMAESEVSATIESKPVDTFAPAVPSGSTAVPGARSIELLWDRNTEKDLAGYRVYRDGKRITETLVSPAYSDKAVQPMVKYKYQVTAIDNGGNESELSPPYEAVIP